MTPLCHALMKRFVLPIRKRDKVYDPDNLLSSKLLDDFHCFEVSEISELVRDLTGQLEDDCKEGADPQDALRQCIFLPAPRTWIESRHKGVRSASYLVDDGNGWADQFIIQPPRDDDRWCIFRVGCLSLSTTQLHRWDKESEPFDGASWIRSCLAVINTPKIIMRQQHMPHRGLQRDLIKAGKVNGKYPLHAWTEILLRVRPPEVSEGDHEAHLTGARALHFVRKHIRIRLGKLEYVSAHWRGDASIGIKRSRYRVAP